MPHKYVTPTQIKDLEEEIRVCRSSIERIKSVKRGGPEGFKELAVQVREFLETAREKKNQALDLMMINGAGTPVDARIQEKSALICRGQEKAFEIVLEMLENPDGAITYYARQQEICEKELAKYRTLEQRPA